MKKHDIPTPALVVDLDKLERNIQEMAERASRAGKNLRPHIKTHKTPIIAHMQMRAGAVGIVCAKLGEAEVMAAAGIADIFIAYPIVGRDKVERLLDLARWVPRISTSDPFPDSVTVHELVLQENVFEPKVHADSGSRLSAPARASRTARVDVGGMPGG